MEFDKNQKTGPKLEKKITFSESINLRKPYTNWLATFFGLMSLLISFMVFFKNPKIDNAFFVFSFIGSLIFLNIFRSVPLKCVK